MTELNIEDLYKTYTTDEQIKESFDRVTAPTGRYTYNVTKVEKLIGADDHVVPALRGRPYARLWGRMSEVVDGVEKKRGNVGCDVSWETRRIDAPGKPSNGKPDKQSKLWGQLVVALGDKAASAGTVLERIAQYPVSIYVNESFKTPEGYRTARTPEERKEYRGQGFESHNFVESISKV
jgi:hypothetical protein